MVRVIKVRKVFLLASFVCSFFVSSPSIAEENTQPKKVIFMIGDGMGLSYLSAYRYYKQISVHGQKPTQTLFDKYLVGVSGTSPDDESWVTDSAAGATALAGGKKSFLGAVGVDGDKEPVESLFVEAKKKGWLTALVATSSITHATPASFYAHVESRDQHAAIADWFVDGKVNGKPLVDLAIGGGKRYFSRSDRNLIAELAELGYQYADDSGSLEGLPALALYADDSPKAALDSEVGRLATMTAKALELLDKEGGPFVIMIEASQIDWCGHKSDIRCAMAEMEDFELAFSQAVDYVQRNKDALLVLTADHETGGLALGSNGIYKWDPQTLQGIRYSTEHIARALKVSNKLAQQWERMLGFPLPEGALEELEVARDSSVLELQTKIKKLVDKKTNTGWTTTGHTAQDVPVIATGAGAEAFRGFQDNTEIAEKLKQYIR